MASIELLYVRTLYENGTDFQVHYMSKYTCSSQEAKGQPLEKDMAYQKRYTNSAIAALWLAFAAFILLVSVTWNVVFAAGMTKTAKFSCDGIGVMLFASNVGNITGSISTYPGTWVEVPGTEDYKLKLFNIDTGQLAIMGDSLDGIPFLQIYRDVPTYGKHQPLHSLRCRVK